MLCVCVCVLVSVIMHATRIFSVADYIVICDLTGFTIFFHIISYMAGFSKKIIYLINMCVFIFPTTSDWNISHPKKNSSTYYHKGT
jgi:hypothetical protein